jgi:2-dehydro-3-deoxyphosphogluconate aldolase / (4S)-4-hydroxy-2-oxoglutarate aldolase
MLVELLRQSRILPVLVIDELEHAVPLATTLRDAGLKSLEITLRRPTAMEAIRRIVADVDGVAVGAGTVTTVAQLAELKRIGAAFAVSPGTTPTLVRAAQDVGLPYLPGVVTPSEVMHGMELGLQTFKYFPAGALGGVGALKAYADVFPDVTFCPTGGVGPDNAAEYFALRNVVAVGSSWLAPTELVSTRDWRAITARVVRMLAL